MRTPHPHDRREHPRTRTARSVTLSTTAAAAALLVAMAMPLPAHADPEAPELEEASIVEVPLAGVTELDDLVDFGADIAALDHSEAGFTASVVLRPGQDEELASSGFELGDIIYTESDAEDRLAEREATIAEHEAENTALQEEATPLDDTETDTDTVTVVRADYFESAEGEYLSVEAKTSDGQDENFELTVERDDGSTQTLTRFFDAGVYMYHRGAAPVDERPDSITVTSPNGGSDTSEVDEWLPEEPDENPPPFTDFVTSYLTPGELDERIEQLADEFPELAEIVELPHQTNGYRRHAQALFPEGHSSGSGNDSAFTVQSRDWGHEGGNDITIELVDPGTANAELDVTTIGSGIRVHLGTDADGEPTSTAADVVTALNNHAGHLVHAFTFRGSDGDGVVEPAEQTRLDDGLSAPDSVPRDPQTVQMLRIGAERTGDQMGVLAYSQEHAREWQTPLVAIETAERLLRNYAVHEPTRQLVDNLDIFIVPSVNPDGTHYSFHDFAMQRRNMTNHCPEQTSDPLLRDHWGVDLNRNHDSHTLWDGYAGASTSCLSDSFAGPEPQSEPEAQNVAWIADEYPNIEFAMNIHSWGDYFMWAPGSYIADGRVPAPRPEIDEEAFFWGASEHILGAIQNQRGTVVPPARTGPIIDVLYSAAGNSGDYFWYEHDIYAWAFELGTEGFQPEWPEAHQQAMEYSNGLYAMLEVADELDRNNVAPRSHLDPGTGSYDGPVEVSFETTEPAAIFYTLDGSRPDFDSTRLQSAGVREGAETLRIEDTTTINWFAVDAAGNIERHYEPGGTDRNYRSATITIED
ncbi:M14 family metallopeptidase [Lipingzhangella sp. LS1_29]|uniref:M14 family metallopeptidase n=1 Tax=Lipingzhangella rawalii TaxID=2055835 RepID=A0ABU2H3F9_9ACTN|nr:M14 family metallopeptidase [Lipingzhangella rawalii]MDS1269833.1 M14 family metallopeptidase [Lipingzhangella rawalii]